MSVDVGTASFDAIGIGGIGWVWPFSMALMLDASFQLDLLWFILSYQKSLTTCKGREATANNK